MSAKPIVIHCIYTEDHQSLAELLEESFRLYLQRTVASLQEKLLQAP